MRERNTKVTEILTTIKKDKHEGILHNKMQGIQSKEYKATMAGHKQHCRQDQTYREGNTIHHHRQGENMIPKK